VADSKRERAIQAIESRLLTIAISNGFNLDIKNVNRARRSYDDSELPAISIFDGIESSEYKYSKSTNILELNVEAHNLYGDINPSVMANMMIADIIQAITNGDTTLSGLVDSIQYSGSDINYPEDGDVTVSALVSFNILYSFNKGDPYT